jgi:predicted HD phosphohydrolase
MADGEVKHDELQPQAKFHAMTEGTAEDWQAISAANGAFAKGLPDRLLAHLEMLRGDCGGFSVDRLEHSLQTATRAHRDGRDEEYVVCALLHDIGDILGPANHAEIAAVILKPYVSERNHWMLDHHGIFQGYYFFHHLGLDRDMREQFRGHPDFEYTAQFCHLYDQSAFDPNYDTMPLSAFEPMLRRVVASPKRSIYKRAAA